MFVIFSQENNKNLIVTGPPGSGKTVIITEALKMKVAQCKQKDIPVKIILATFSRDACPQLCQDLKQKYNLDYLMKEFQADTKNMEELFEGWSVLDLMYLFQFIYPILFRIWSGPKLAHSFIRKHQQSHKSCQEEDQAG